MLKKARQEASSGDEGTPKDLGKTVLESSRQIWLAGLGAFSRAQAEGTKVFEALVEQGQNLESKTRRAASQTAAAAAGAAAQKAKDVQAIAGGTWDKLEQVFEDRVARALKKLGVYTQDDVTRLSDRVDALAEAVNELLKRGGRSPMKAAPRKRARKRSTKQRAKAHTGDEGSSQATQAPRKTSRRRAAKAAE
ncbi:MAG TPA: phasin family protein [Casimicrobiaceae bacterium]|nr:phasin family protein [Casimicrobiaceae bacterium]